MKLSNERAKEKRPMARTIRAVFGLLLLSVLAVVSAHASDFDSRVKEGFVDSNGVKIHYATVGSGPLIVMIHGFPEYWYTWRHEMEGLADQYQCVAIDQRGYNLSDKPAGDENYQIKFLVGDVIAVIKHFGKDKAIIVGHDWGGAVAWGLALNAPQYVDRLIILNLPHPRGIRRELANNPKQQAASAYARNFQKEGSENTVKPEQLVFWVTDPDAKPKFLEALQRSDMKAMLAYYKENYAKEPYQEDTSPVVKTEMPVLMIHGLKDTALLSDALNNTWDWMGKDFTLVTIPEAGHFVQEDAPEMVTRTIRAWLGR
jgi:epoxide hydrolase 4